MENWLRNTNPWLATGAGLYWASYAFRIMGGEPSYMVSLGASGHVLVDILAVMWVFVAWGLLKRFGIRHAMTAVSITSVAIELTVAACDIFVAQVPVSLAYALACGDFFVLSAFCLFWGLAFASLDKRLAAYNVVTTLVGATAMLLVGRACFSVIPGRGVPALCVAACAAVMTSGKVVLRNRKRTPQGCPRPVTAGLVAQRFAYGFMLGFFPAFAAAFSHGGVNLPITLFALACLALVALVTMSPAMPSYTTLPMLALVCVVMLCLPGLDDGTMGISPVLIGGTWLAWQTLSSVQLSDLKDELGISELDISLIDKVLITLSILAGAAASGLVMPIVQDYGAATASGVASALLGATCVLVLLSGLSLAKLVGARQESDFRMRVKRENAEREACQLAEIGNAYGLSTRERQVFEMLVRGDTIAAIAEAMGVAYNTAKAHTTHIYQKLGVHSRNEMIELLEMGAGEAGSVSL